MLISTKKGYVNNYAVIGGIVGGIEVSDFSEEEFAKFEKNYTAYKLENGQLILDEDKLAAEQAAAEQAALTARYIPSEAQSAAAVGRMVLAQLSDLTADAKLRVSGLYDTWQHETVCEAGDIYNHAGQTWECYAKLDPALNPGVTPDTPAWHNFFRVLHGRTPSTARPFVPPHAEYDMYRAGEYMVWTDGSIKRATQDTAYSPEDYSPAWENAERTEEN